MQIVTLRPGSLEVVTIRAGIFQGNRTFRPAGTTITCDENLDVDRAVTLVLRGDAKFVDAKCAAALTLLQNVKTQSPGTWVENVAALLA